MNGDMDPKKLERAAIGLYVVAVVLFLALGLHLFGG